LLQNNHLHPTTTTATATATAMTFANTPSIPGSGAGQCHAQQHVQSRVRRADASSPQAVRAPLSFQFYFSYMPLPNIQRLFVSGTPLTPRTGRLVLHAFRYNTKPVISVATARPPYPACCS
jgi:hypothetical protein